MTIAIEVNNLSVHYNKIVALKNINFKVREGDFLGIVGSNGGGKSTLLKTIAGLLPPSTGEVKVFGKTAKKKLGIIGYVPQFSNFNKSFPINVQDVVLTGRLCKKSYFFHRYTKKDKRFIKNIMEYLNIYDLKNRQIGELSGGQLQRVLIARALALEPKIILLDEPTANLDQESKAIIYSLLEKIKNTVTILMVTHDRDLINNQIDFLLSLNTTLTYYGKPFKENTYDCIHITV